MPAVSTCLAPSCRASVDGTVPSCPVCGGRMRTPRSVRVAGGVLLVCGLFLGGLVSYLWALLAPSMAHPGDLVGGTSFSGTAEQARQISMMFGAIIVFGIASIGYGLFMIATGRRSIPIMVGVLALAGVLVLLAWQTMMVLPD